ncbi:hypothetical protein CQ13_14610 [Bradyrhizobium retamae]|uniref:Uncharacterized protein n=1 Tax=Bradyrhizobium retamae TaxID=1300035 RepID=A0A0R3ND32_9BRAD|nr:hypothetical protein [Bradyrhizobium retamae]KRR30027.1 hypothetical protein CQ13_14610 [Bradyrhizobium retamae]
MKDMPFERGVAVGEDAMEGPLRDAEFGSERRHWADSDDIGPQIGIDQAEQVGTGELMAGARGETQQSRQKGDDVWLVLSLRRIGQGNRVANHRGNRTRNNSG